MRIYLAGPEVFLADSAAVADAKRLVCAAHGHVGVFPTDPLPDGTPGARDAPAIYRHCEAQMRGCHAIVANLTPFRGPSADVGTVYELGFMRALGRIVGAYTNVAAPLAARTLALLGPTARRRGSGWEDADGLSIEDFDRRDNLMLDEGIAATGGRFIAQDAPPDRRWHDLAAFTRCVAILQPASVSSA